MRFSVLALTGLFADISTELAGIEGKRQLVRGVYSAIAEAYNLPRNDVPLPSGKVVSTTWVLGFFSEYPLDQASLDDLMASENPMVLESTEARKRS